MRGRPIWPTLSAFAARGGGGKDEIMRFSLILVSSCLVGGLLGGCGGSTRGGGFGPVPKSQFMSRYESVVCDNIGSCCKTAGYKYDAAACKIALGKSDTATFLKTTTATYDAQAAGDCLGAIAGLMSSCKGFDNVTIASCQKVFTGTKAAGQPCTTSTDCAPVSGADVSCDSTSTGGGGASGSGGSTGTGGSFGSSQGVCVVTPRGKKGDGCDATCTESGNSTSCDSMMGGAGGATGAGGGSSTGNASCYTNEGLYCGANGKCDALIPIGQPCPTDSGCVDGAFCDNGTCAAKKAVGSACSTYDTCKDGTYCKGLDASATGTCATPQPAGAACKFDDECQNTYYCQNGKCVSYTGITADMCSGQSSGGAGGSGGTTGVGTGGATGVGTGGTASGGSGATPGTGGAFGGTGGA